MLIDLGHTVFFYGSEGSDVKEYCGNSPRLHFIETHKLSDIRRDWGDGDNRFELGYDHTKELFRHDFNSKKTASTMKFYMAAITHINKVKKEDDFLLLTQGTYQEPIDKATGLYLAVEPGIGYRGSYAKFRAFESSYIQNFTYGGENPKGSVDGNYYDRVIPNYFDPADFELAKKKKDYYLFIGRMIMRKGVWTAVKATEAMGKQLILAGQQDPEIDVTKLPKHCKFIGSVGIEERKKLMSEALGVFVPSVYLEPFAGVHVEAMLSGTPPITTNFGVFPETIPDAFDHMVGFRCNTLKDFVEAGHLAPFTNPSFIREYANKFTMEKVAQEFQRWFDDLHIQWESAVDSSKTGWHRL